MGCREAINPESKHYRKVGIDTQSMSKIRIANPKPGSARYTTVNQAERYVRRGEAVLIGQDLHFLSESEQRHMRNVEAQISISERRASDVYIKGTVWWDGDDPGGMHIPGEVVC